MAVADQVQVDLNIVPNCDTTTGHWKVDYLVHNQTPVTVVFERAEDPTTGARRSPVPPFPLVTGSQSTGPHALYQRSGGACVTRPEVSSTEGCDGTVRITLANGSTANTPGGVHVRGRLPRVQGMFRTLVLEPGEWTTVTYTLPMPRGQIDLYIKSVRVLSARVPTLLECRMQAPRVEPSRLPPPPRRRRVLS